MFGNTDELLVLDDDLPMMRNMVMPWKVMVIDDDGEVHQATRFALSNLEVMGRPISLVHAYSGAEAESLLQQMSDIAVILLDVVMEGDDSGLLLIDFIRNRLAHHSLRIILRTGQPGSAPEAAVVSRYDVHDYMLKSDVNRERLVTSLTTAVRAYNQLEELATAKQQMMVLSDIVCSASQIQQTAQLGQLLARGMLRLFALQPRLVLLQLAEMRPLQTGVVCYADDARLTGQMLADIGVNESDDIDLLRQVLFSSSHDISNQVLSVELVSGGRLTMLLPVSTDELSKYPDAYRLFSSIVSQCPTSFS